MRILLSGGRGFIGRHVSERLGSTFEILAPSRQELDFSDAEAIETWFARNSVDAVIHAAVRPGHRNAADPSLQLETNLRMYANLLRCADSWGRMIYLSSGAIYGTQGDVIRATEADVGKVVPADEHGFARYIISALVAAQPRVVELRPFGVFGPYEDYEIRFPSNAICKGLSGLAITLRQDRVFSYIWVEDLVDVIAHFLTSSTTSGAFNVVPDETESLLDIGTQISALTGGVPVQVARPGRGFEYTGDNGSLRAEIPAIQFTSMANALERLTAWYSNRRETIDISKLLVDK